MKTILILFGGCSSEYSVSLQSAYGVLSHMDPARFRPLMVAITRDGRWLRYTGPLSRLLDDSYLQEGCTPCSLCLDRSSRQLLLPGGVRESFDAAFPVLHGKNGEDGTVQGLLELCGVPLIGCGCLSSALCMDKDRAHKIAALSGIAVPRGTVFRQGDPEDAMEAAAAAIGYPLFVKPVRAGSSVGISMVNGPSRLRKAVASAFAHDREILIEEAVPGFEVGCAVLGSETLTVGRVDEIELSSGFFDFEEKYTLKTSAIHCPARICPEREEEIQAAAMRIYRALDCRGFARVDFFLTPNGRLLFNEVNTIPGFTAHSRYPVMMERAGLNLTDLLTRLMEEEVGK